LLDLDWPLALRSLKWANTEMDPTTKRVLHSGLRVRMGIDTGRPNARRNPVTKRMDYFGTMVNRAARVSAVAHGGQILCTDSVVEGLNQEFKKQDLSDFSVDLSTEFNPSFSQSSSPTSPSLSTSTRSPRRSPRRNSESLAERSPSTQFRKLSVDLCLTHRNEPLSPLKINEPTTPRLATPHTVSTKPESPKISSPPLKLQLKAKDVVVSDMGSHSLKGIYQPVAIHQLSLPSPSPLSLRTFPPLRLPKDSLVPDSGTTSQSISTGSSSISSPKKEKENTKIEECNLNTQEKATLEEEKTKARPNFLQKFGNLSQYFSNTNSK